LLVGRSEIRALSQAGETIRPMHGLASRGHSEVNQGIVRTSAAKSMTTSLASSPHFFSRIGILVLADYLLPTAARHATIPVISSVLVAPTSYKDNLRVKVWVKCNTTIKKTLTYQLLTSQL
jgi:hypothetical protein